MAFPALPAKISRSALWAVLVVVVALCAYGNSLQNGFVWDDQPIIVKNAQNRDPGALGQIALGLDNSRATEKNPYYRPLTRLSYWVEYQVHGLNPALCHLANLALHAGNALLVYRLGLLLFALETPAALAALLFALHPVNSEAVNFLSTRNTLLSTLFVLAACLAFIGGMSGNRRRGALCCGLFFLAGTFSKESALCLIPLLPVLAQRLSGSPPREALTRALPALGACTGAALVYLCLRHLVLSGAGVTLQILPGLGERLLEILYLVPCSLLPVVWPAALTPYYPLPVQWGPLVPGLIAAWLAIGAVLFWVAGRGRCTATVVGLCWYLLFYLPACGIVPLPSAPMAERYLYLPAIGVWFIAAEVARRATVSFPAKRTLLVAAAAALLLALGVRTVLRNQDWQSNYTLFARLAETSPQMPFAHHNLGTAYLDDLKDLPRAQAEFERTLALDPQYPRTQTEFGYLEMLRGNPGGADVHLQQAIARDPEDAEAHFNRALVLEQLGRPAEAIPHLEKFLAIDNPEFAGTRTEAQERLAALKGQH